MSDLGITLRWKANVVRLLRLAPGSLWFTGLTIGHFGIGVIRYQRSVTPPTPAPTCRPT